jgi:hypothetical protein
MTAASLDREDIRWAPQEGFRTGVHEVSSRYVHRVAKYQELYIVQGSPSYETEERPTRSFGIRGAGNVGATANLGSYVPP